MKETINCCQNELKVSQFSLRDGCKCQDNCLGRHSLGLFHASPQVTWGCVAAQDHLVTLGLSWLKECTPRSHGEAVDSPQPCGHVWAWPGVSLGTVSMVQQQESH